MNSKSHWNSVYGSNCAESVSWYAPHLSRSLDYVKQAASGKSASIIDVGGGESTLVDDLVGDGYVGVTVLDISATALEVTQRRLGSLAKYVAWSVGDVLKVTLPAGGYDIWHDRAVFHFLTTQAQRQRYVAQVVHAVRPGGFVMVGTFGPEGPDQCSGLPTSRYSPDELHGTFGPQFELIDSRVEMHLTPAGVPQQFVYCFCRRRESPPCTPL